MKGFLFKVYNAYHIVTEDDENTAYPVVEESIKPDSQNISLKFTTNVILHTGKRRCSQRKTEQRNIIICWR